MANKKMGRPPIQITRKEFEQLCAIQCTLIEMAACFDCSEDTIERWCVKEYGKTFAEVFRLKRQKGIKSLRRAMFSNALNGNATLQIWLSKQLLNYAEKSEIRSHVVVEDNRESQVDEILRNANELARETKNIQH